MRSKTGRRNQPLAGDELVVAVSGDGTFLHVSVVDDLLRHMRGDHAEQPPPRDEIDAPGGEAPAVEATDPGEALRRPTGPSPAASPAHSVDFFDSAGTPAVPVVDPRLAVVGFRRVGRPDPDAVLARIEAALDLAQQRLDADPELGRRQSLPPATDVPRPQGQLADVLAALDVEFDVRGGPGHRAGWFHNLFHV